MKRTDRGREGEVLQRSNYRRVPSVSCGPIDLQHVVCECFPEHQILVLWFRFQRRRLFHVQTRGLTSRRRAGGSERVLFRCVAMETKANVRRSTSPCDDGMPVLLLLSEEIVASYSMNLRWCFSLSWGHAVCVFVITDGFSSCRCQLP